MKHSISTPALAGPQAPRLPRAIALHQEDS